MGWRVGGKALASNLLLQIWTHLKQLTIPTPSLMVQQLFYNDIHILMNVLCNFLNQFSNVVLYVGLQLKSAKEQNPFKCFSYALSPFTKNPVDLEKMIWHRTYPIPSEHVRCHVLAQDDDIPQLIAQYRLEYAVAVILINDVDNYALASPSLHSVAPQAGIPVIVITSQDGETLLSILNEYKHPGEVIAHIVSNTSGSSLWSTSSCGRQRISRCQTLNF